MRAENNEPVRAATTVDAMARFRSTSVSAAIAVNPTSSPMLCASPFRPSVDAMFNLRSLLASNVFVETMVRLEPKVTVKATPSKSSRLPV